MHFSIFQVLVCVLHFIIHFPFFSCMALEGHCHVLTVSVSNYLSISWKIFIVYEFFLSFKTQSQVNVGSGLLY